MSKQSNHSKMSENDIYNLLYEGINRFKPKIDKMNETSIDDKIAIIKEAISLSNEKEYAAYALDNLFQNINEAKKATKDREFEKEINHFIDNYKKDNDLYDYNFENFENLIKNYLKIEKETFVDDPGIDIIIKIQNSTFMQENGLKLKPNDFLEIKKNLDAKPNLSLVKALCNSHPEHIKIAIQNDIENIKFDKPPSDQQIKKLKEFIERDPGHYSENNDKIQYVENIINGAVYSKFFELYKDSDSKENYKGKQYLIELPELKIAQAVTYAFIEKQSDLACFILDRIEDPKKYKGVKAIIEKSNKPDLKRFVKDYEKLGEIVDREHKYGMFKFVKDYHDYALKNELKDLTACKENFINEVNSHDNALFDKYKIPGGKAEEIMGVVNKSIINGVKSDNIFAKIIDSITDLYKSAKHKALGKDDVNSEMRKDKIRYKKIINNLSDSEKEEFKNLKIENKKDNKNIRNTEITERIKVKNVINIS